MHAADHEPIDAVLVECFAVSMDDHGLVGRVAVGALDGDPDVSASCAAGLLGSPLDGEAVLHSTSWRYERSSGRLVLTYVCCPDPAPGRPGQRVRPSPAVARSFDPSRPHPVNVTAEAVLRHGLDHLAWLAEHDEAVAAAAPTDPAVWSAIRSLGRRRATRLG